MILAQQHTHHQVRKLMRPSLKHCERLRNSEFFFSKQLKGVRCVCVVVNVRLILIFRWIFFENNT